LSGIAFTDGIMPWKVMGGKDAVPDRALDGAKAERMA
jgi:hypothetical protein